MVAKLPQHKHERETAAARLRARSGQVPVRERGVAAVLSMMFLILFGSLAAAMAIASKGNLTTAATHVRVLRAQGAAETGLAVAKARLAGAAARFICSESNVTSTFGTNLWAGNTGSLGTVNVVASKTGRTDLASPAGIAQALVQLHALDQDIVTEAGPATPSVANAPVGMSSEYGTSNWVYTPAVAIEPRSVGGPPPVCYRVRYAPLANGTDVRVIVDGYDFSYTREGVDASGNVTQVPVVRTVMQDFRLSKRVNHAIIAPTRVMVGKNVSIEGALGSAYTNVTAQNGDPFVIHSDFLGLSPVLDAKLNALFNGIRQYDVDGDYRLRVNHPIESQGIPSNAQDFDGDGQPDGAFTDVTGDGYVDDFDVFLKHFDTNGDGRVALSWGPGPAEFTVDNDLALMIDSARPDRNRNGVWGYVDTNNNGRWDPGEPFNDYDSVNGVNRDQILGYMDGYIDYKDQYAKIRGSVTTRATQAAWTAAQGDLTTRMRGPIVPGNGESPRTFGASTDTIPDLDINSFSTQRTALQNAADGQTFAQQVASQLGVSVAALGTYTETQSPGPNVKRYFRLDPDANLDGKPDNWSTAYYEKMPFAAPAPGDYYYRPVYENMTFKDVQIPEGNNGLYINCTFVGVTWVRSRTDNNHVLWGEFGRMVMDTSTGKPKPAFPRSIYGDSTGETSYPTMLPSSAIPPAQMVLMSNPPLDKADIPANEVAITQGYADLPDPLVVGGKRITDTKTLSNNIRFHDCLFVGSIVSDSPQNYTQTRNKLQFTGGTRFVQRHPTQPNNTALNPESIDQDEIAKSSMMVPHYSVDLGAFNSPQTQNIALQGAIIAGVVDIRGNATIDGALMLTFNPVLGEGPLRDARGQPLGNPADFNTTIGYFGPDDGDEESLDPNALPLVGGQRLVGFDTNGDGIADPGATSGTPVYFNGYGRIQIRFDPNMRIPSGVMLPMQYVSLPGTYKEGKL